ncbi:hypothetical protein HMPREF9193_01808 [Treponema lecithinolyticum ATCC 700332]|uniref:Uncharacterized protein n=1 Tax=Treponema lecithinolyticum ATCC 700332 TaxID=1321815 RepID=A0ABN0NXV0_TRELE|nr:hypothetical protein HMPREF9193_01808 [Treponema lecithinolyticum ATCC 700332]
MLYSTRSVRVKCTGLLKTADIAIPKRFMAAPCSFFCYYF